MHSLAVGLFLNESEVHYFEDIGASAQRSPRLPAPAVPALSRRAARAVCVCARGLAGCVACAHTGTEYSGSGQNCLYLWNKLHGELGIDAFERLRVAALET